MEKKEAVKQRTRATHQPILAPTQCVPIAQDLVSETIPTKHTTRQKVSLFLKTGSTIRPPPPLWRPIFFNDQGYGGWDSFGAFVYSDLGLPTRVIPLFVGGVGGVQLPSCRNLGTRSRNGMATEPFCVKHIPERGFDGVSGLNSEMKNGVLPQQ